MSNEFDPDKYLAEEGIEQEFDPESYLAEEVETSATEASLRGSGQGLTWDNLDEIIAGGRAITDDMVAAITGDMSGPMPKRDELGRITNLEELKGNYDKYLAEERAKFEKAKEDQPVAYYGSEIASGILPALLTGGATAAARIGKEAVKGGVRGLAKGQGLKQAAKVGAGYGAASGFGASEGETPQEILGDVAMGAGLGAGLGIGIPVAGKALKEAGKVAMKPVSTLGDKFPSLKTGFQFGKKYGLADADKIDGLLYDNTVELVQTMSKNFQKLGLQKEAAEAKAAEIGNTYDVTKGIENVADQFLEQAKGLLPADAEKARKIASEIQESFLKVDVKGQELLAKVEKEIQKKLEKSANVKKKAIQKGEAAAVKEAEKSGASLEQLNDIEKTFEEVSEIKYDTKGGAITGQEAKFKDEYMNIEGEMVPYEYRKKFIQDTTLFQPSKVDIREVDDKLIAEYRDEATGEVFTKTGPKSQFSDKDFSNLTLEELSDLTSEYGRKGFEEGDSTYKELYKVVRNKLEEAGLDIPANKKEMFNLFQTMAILGIDKTRLKYPSAKDMVDLSKKIPGKMNLEKTILQRDILPSDSELSKKLDDLRLISDAQKYLGEGYTSATGEFTKAGAIQKGVASASDYAGAAYGKVSRPVNNVANKVTQMTDEGLQYVSKSFNESNNAGIQAMGRQLEEALQQEGPVKNALIWSLSQNPAFRKQVEKALPKLDEGLEKDLGIEQDTSPKTLEDLPEGGEPSRDPAGEVDSNESPEKRRDYIYKKLIDSGLERKNALAILSNIAHETGDTFDPSIKQRGVGKVSDWWKKSKGGRGTGLLQWDDRRFALKDFAEKKGTSWDNLDTQIDYLLHELSTTERGGYSKVEEAETIKDKVKMFSDKVERPGKPHYDQRFKRAEELEKLYKDEEKPLPETESGSEDMEEAIERAKSEANRVMKQKSSGADLPLSHLDDALGAIEDLPIDEVKKEVLQDKLIEAETYRDMENLKQLLETLKMS